MVFWDTVFDEVAAGYPDVGTDMALVDALSMWMVKNPEWFDVVVASNLFGDIITDLGAMLQGGMGFAAGGNIDPDHRFPSMFEPIQGSAPKYTGQRRVNPIASVEAVRMMLDHAGEYDAADTVGAAIAEVPAEGEVGTGTWAGPRPLTRSWRPLGSACTANDRHSRLGALIASPPQVPAGSVCGG